MVLPLFSARAALVRLLGAFTASRSVYRRRPRPCPTLLTGGWCGALRLPKTYIFVIVGWVGSTASAGTRRRCGRRTGRPHRRPRATAARRGEHAVKHWTATDPRP